MVILQNEKLEKYTTFKMGGIAKNLYFPESVDELIELCNEKPQIYNYIIGGGSNLIINDNKTFEDVLCTRKISDEIKKYGDGRYYISASNRLQKVIRTINEDEYGGIEYLFSVPGLIGGAIYMNAGRGRKHKKCISDYIEKVDYIQNGKLCSLKKSECGFDYRTSIFQTMQNCIIIGAEFKFEKTSKEDSKKRIQERIDLCKEVQDMSAPSFGSVFCVFNKTIMDFVKKVNFGYKNGVQFSKKTKNWMLHKEKGDFKQAIKVLERVKRMHKLFRKEYRLEVRIWK